MSHRKHGTEGRIYQTTIKRKRRQPHSVAFCAERLGFGPALPLERSEKPLGENPISNARRQPHLVAFLAERLGFVPALPLERSEKPLGENPFSKARRQPHSVAFLAERLGFEPRVPVRVRRISSAVHSTTLASLHCFCGCKDTKVNSKFKIYKIKNQRKMSFFILLLHVSHVYVLDVLMRMIRKTSKGQIKKSEAPATAMTAPTISCMLTFLPKI